MEPKKVNAHLHTPYSFSAFQDVDDALDRAKSEGVEVVGINDFYTTRGYEEWAKGCEKRGLYPLFGIEFIALDKKDQEAGLRVNDPANPGRTYLSGKGLAYPFRLAEPYASRLNGVVGEANRQVEAMCAKLNKLLKSAGFGFSLDFRWITSELTKGLVRERHLAKALRVKLLEQYGGDAQKAKEALETLFGGKALKASMDDIAGVENEIRGNLLKAGGAAFVPEEAAAFLPVEQVREIILAAGGIPTYPFLADNPSGGYTDFEGDVEQAARRLTERGFHSVEFITTRNDVKRLEEYASNLHEQGFVVTFGSEHNTPAMEPIELFARGGVPLTPKLKRINYEGACVIVAHQHLVGQGLGGYVEVGGNSIDTPGKQGDEEKQGLQGLGSVDRSRREEFVKLGARLIQGK